MRNWLKNDSAKQDDQINDSNKQVDAISYSKKNWLTPEAIQKAIQAEFTQKLLISRFVPKILPVFIGPINSLVTADVVGVQEILSPHQTVPLEASVTDAACSCTRIFRTTGKVRRTGRDVSTPKDVNSSETNFRLNSPSPGSNPNSITPVRYGAQDVISPSHISIAKRDRNAEPLEAPIDVSLAVNGQSTSFFRKVIVLETVPGEVADVNACERMNFTSNSVLGESPKFMDLGLSPANTADKLNSVLSSATRAEGLTENSEWIASRHGCKEFTLGIVSKAKAYSDYIKNSEFETMNVFERENSSETRINSGIRLTENNSWTQINSGIRLTENNSLTRLTENSPLTRPTEKIPLTRPTDFVTRLTEKSTDTTNRKNPTDTTSGMFRGT